ncbi:MAG: GspH/FimT family pseudopilin [Georgfuchsia sp.]
MPCRRGGFSLVEMMIVIAITAILLALGIPSFTAYLANLKVRTTAEGFLSGLQLARADAVRRNARVEFILTILAPTVDNLATDTADLTDPAFADDIDLPPNHPNWMIRTADTSAFIEGKSAAEGSSSAQSGRSPVEVRGSVSSITFNGLGNTDLLDTATFQFTNNAAGDCVADGGPVRCLNVMVATGGRIKLCDPAVPAGDTRGC